MDREELAGWLRLGLTPGVGDGTVRRLLAAFGPPGAIFSQAPPALGAICSAAQVAALQVPPEGFEPALASAWRWLHEVPAGESARRVVTLGDAD